MATSEQVKNKMIDLMDSLSFISATYRTKKRKNASCFISYCWSNSKSAVSKGTKHKEGAIGRTDPRDLKKQLEEAGISCWMDIEQIGQSGLIQDITEGLKRAKVVIACVSDEYVLSKNCQMEFRFASMTLRVPILIVIVGTGLEWMKSEIGMLSMAYRKVDLQYREDENKEILNFVKQHISTDQDNDEGEFSSAVKHTELLELTERKFLRNIANLHIEHNFENMPHLPLIDFEEGSTPDNITGYRFVFLCECEEGWHLPKNLKSIKWDLEINDPGTEEKLITWSPYLYRIYTLLKETDIQLISFDSDSNSYFFDKFIQTENSFNENKDDLSEAYLSMINVINFAESQVSFANNNGYLKKCLGGGSNGVLWLCSDHQELPKINVIDSGMHISTMGIIDKYFDDVLEKIQDKDEFKKLLESATKFVETKVAIEQKDTNENNDKKESTKITPVNAKIATLITLQGRTRSHACILL